MPLLHSPSYAASDPQVCKCEQGMSLSRRDFLKSSGALIVSFSAASVAGPFAMAQGPFDTHRSHIDPHKLDSWIAVAADGSVTGLTGKCDFGQGMFTAQ